MLYFRKHAKPHPRLARVVDLFCLFFLPWKLIYTFKHNHLLIYSLACMNDHQLLFISYAREDNNGDPSSLHYLDEVRKALVPLQHAGVLSSVADVNIPAGALWNNDIVNAISHCRAALLLVSPNFLASEYIKNTEIPLLLHRVHTGECTLFILVLRQCAIQQQIYKYPDPHAGPFQKSLDEFNFVHDRTKPINSLTQHERDKVLQDLVQKLEKFFAGDSFGSKQAITPEKPELLVSVSTKKASSALAVLREQYLPKAIPFWRRRLTKYFVDCGAQELIGDNPLPSIQSYLREITPRESSGWAFILGDFGEGKSTQSLHFAISTVEDILQGSGRAIPIYIPLDRYPGHREENGAHFDQFVIQYLRDVFGIIGISWADLEAAFDCREICFILDGLDEIRSIHDCEDAEIELTHILAMIGMRGNVVLTGRTAVLENTLPEAKEMLRALAERNGIQRLNILQLKPLTDDQVQYFLTIANHSSLLRSILLKSARALLRRPIILWLLAVAPPPRNIDYSSMSEEELLDRTIGNLLQRRRSQMQADIPFGEWRRLLESCAVRLLLANKLEMGSVELREATGPIANGFSFEERTANDLQFELRVKTIFAVTGDGLQFGHVIFRDFLAAFEIARRLLKPGKEDVELNGLELPVHLVRYIQYAVQVFLKRKVQPTLGLDRPKFLPPAVARNPDNWCWISPGLSIISNHKMRAKSPYTLKYFDRGYWIGATPLTIQECRQLPPSSFPSTLANKPIPSIFGPQVPLTKINLKQAEDWAKALYNGRLPTEAEWERAARWVDATYPTDGQLAPANYDRNIPPRVRGARPNPWGLFDATGSVWQWTNTKDLSTNRAICKGAWWGAEYERLLDGGLRLDPLIFEQEHIRTGLRIVIDQIQK